MHKVVADAMLPEDEKREKDIAALKAEKLAKLREKGRGLSKAEAEKRLKTARTATQMPRQLLAGSIRDRHANSWRGVSLLPTAL